MPHPVVEHSKHYIICGYGRVGREVAAGLRHRNRSIVAIDRNRAALEGAAGFHTITGDVTDDTVLIEAGVTTALGLVAGTGSDETNLAITLSARALNATLLVVARANHPEAEAKLLRAGASRVVSPYAIGAHRMATQLVSPGVIAFLDAIRDGDTVDLWIEEVTIAAESSAVGAAVSDVLPRTPGLPNLIALRHGASGRLVANPAPEIRLALGDVVIVVGSRLELERLIARLTTQPSRAPSGG